MRERPQARTGATVVKTLGDEVLVYDLEHHRGHSLNRVAAAVWRACDGTRDVPALAAAATAAVGHSVAPDAVRLALQGLGRARLLATRVESAGLTRREMVRRLGTAAAVALPLVSSVVVPTAAHAQSCIPEGPFTCSTVTPPFCCPGLTCFPSGCG